MYYNKKERSERMLNIMRTFSFEIDGTRIAAVTKTIRDIMMNNLGISEASIKHYLVEMAEDGIIRKGNVCEYVIPHDEYASLAEEEAAQA